jgi:RNA polymerase sigma-70 factor (ECF subfamily)
VYALKGRAGRSLAGILPQALCISFLAPNIEPTGIFSWHFCLFSGTLGHGSVPVRVGIRLMRAAPANDPEGLLRQARAGDAAALGRLLELYRAYLGFLAGQQIGRHLQGKVDPSDLVQEAFLGATRDFAQFRGRTEPEFLAWLRQILARLLANLVRHYLGTRRRDVRLERQLEAELEQSSQCLGQGLVDPCSSPSEKAVRHEQAARVMRALERLPEADRQLLTLRQVRARGERASLRNARSPLAHWLKIHAVP